MKGWVYLLLSQKDNKTYLGSTTDLDTRINEHNSGLCRSTKFRRPLKLIYSEKYDEIRNARNRERFLKTKLGRKELKIIYGKIS